MARLVMKFGGTSVGDVERIAHVVRHVQREVEAGYEVAVIVSAMAGETNRLVALAQAIAPLHDAREYDVVVSAGEQLSAGLLAMGLNAIGVPARSWLAWQLPIKTDNAHARARILDIATDKIEAQFAQKRVAVIAGFQGLAEDGRITTLGRGGSDTSAVAMAVALKAERCDIYTDVDGIYTTDPHIVPDARRLPLISYEEMLESASLGAKVLQTRSVELAMVHNIKLQVRASFADPDEAYKADGANGTFVCNEEFIMEQEVVSGIAYSRDEAKITLRHVADKPGVAAAVFGPLADAAIAVDMIVQNISPEDGHTDITFTIPTAELERARQVIEDAHHDIGYEQIESAGGLAKVSIVGIGMRSHAGVAQTMFKVLAEQDINIHVISTSEIKVSVLIDTNHVETAVRALHAAYELDKIGDATARA